MQPTEQPAPSSTDVHATEPADRTEASPEQTDEHPSPSWWNTLTSKLSGRRGEEAAPSAEEPTAESELQTRTLSNEEIARLVQSEADRREALRNKEARDAERKRLRDEDPYEYAEQERLAEAQQAQNAQLGEFFQNIGRLHDSATLVPLMDALDEKERQRLLALPGAGDGVEGRKLLTTEAMKALEKQWRAEGAKDAEAKLRRNQTFRKQLMSEFGGSSEPEVVPQSGAVNNGVSSEDINNWLRSQIGGHRSA